MEYVALLAVLILAAAILYSSVGHAGASGYLAAMLLHIGPRLCGLFVYGLPGILPPSTSVNRPLDAPSLMRWHYESA
jgi:hypothetical protein